MKALQLTHEDNIATVLEAVTAGATVELMINGAKFSEIKATTDVPYGFKIAVKDIKAGASVIKYGHVIGKASKDIVCGELVHVHNIEGNRGRGDLAK